MQKIFLVILFAFFPLSSQAFYTWVDDEGTKHISTHPRECIDESTKTIKLNCQLNAGFLIKGDEKYTRRYLDEERFRLANPGLVKGECGYPGRVYVNGKKETDALDDFKKMQKDFGEIIQPYIVEIESDIKEAQEKAKSTCKDVRITANIDQKKLEEEIKELKRQKQMDAMSEELSYLREYFQHPPSIIND